MPSPAQYGYQAPQPPDDYYADSVYIDPPLEQPPPLRIEWAPPPMLEEQMPPQPYVDAIWTGGYWVWQDNWIWARGRWSAPPRHGYRWVRPYYEHRGGSVLFINGFWAAPGVSFQRPPPNLHLPFARVRPGVVHGPRVVGPEGVFMPPPHGSRHGLIVPAKAPEPQAPRGQTPGQTRVWTRESERPGMPSPVQAAPSRPPVDAGAVSTTRPHDADNSRRDTERAQRMRDRDQARTSTSTEATGATAQTGQNQTQPANMPRTQPMPRDSSQEAVQRNRPETRVATPPPPQQREQHTPPPPRENAEHVVRPAEVVKPREEKREERREARREERKGREQ